MAFLHCGKTHSKMPISFIGARILPACAHRKKTEDKTKKKKEISAVNFSTAKMILFLGILTESQFFRSLHLCTSQVGMGEKIGI